MLGDNRPVARIVPIHQLIGLCRGFIVEKPGHGDRVADVRVAEE